ncbi:MAG TPA: tetratricopeptide repeat protein, partial [Pyrinomonadaceae bacterium]|nr:tetratricopeptide repeat protein [Pyrinomonadaceae bacterium]
MKRIFVILVLICGLGVSPSLAQDAQEDTVDSLREEIAATTTFPERVRLQLKLADLLVNTGQKSDALKELNAIAGSGGFDPAGFYNLGNAFARLGETEAALRAYREAITQRRGTYSRAYNNMGVVLLRVGRWDEAYDALNSALKIEHFRYAEASYNLGRVYAARGQNDLAAREWRRALTIEPEHDAAKHALARSHDEEKIVVAEATPSKPAAVNAKPASAPAGAKTLTLDQMSFDFLKRAREASERGNMNEAVYNFRRLLNRQGGYFAPGNLELSYALLSLKQYDEALANLLQVTSRDGARYPISYFHLARTYEMKGDLKNAESAFSQAIASYTPPNAQFLLDLARVREKQNDFKGALDALERYIALMQDRGEKPVWSDQRLAE